MKKLHFALIVAFLLSLLLPFTVQAAGTFFCSATISQGGDGSYANPWACSTQDQLNVVINTNVCADNGGGFLYRLFPYSYVFYDIVQTTQNGQTTCVIRRQVEYPGYPPNTGVELPAPMIAALAVGGALVLGFAGMMLRRKTA